MQVQPLVEFPAFPNWSFCPLPPPRASASVPSTSVVSGGHNGVGSHAQSSCTCMGSRGYCLCPAPCTQKFVPWVLSSPGLALGAGSMVTPCQIFFNYLFKTHVNPKTHSVG